MRLGRGHGAHKKWERPPRKLGKDPRMSPVREVSLTALREIRRNLGSTKGIVILVLFFLGGLIPSLVQVFLLKLVNGETNQEVPEEVKQKFFEGVLLKAYDADVAHYLSTCPMVLFGLLKGTLRFVPLLILLISFDQIAGEIQHRSIRYVAGRSRRESFVVGKALGVWAVISAAILLLHVVVWVVTLAQGSTPAASIVAWGPRMWLFSVVGASAWVGLITLVSSLFRTPIVALLVGVVSSFSIWLINLILELIPSVKGGTWAFPFRYEELLLSNKPHYVGGGVVASIAWGAVMVAIAAVIVKRRDV